MRKAIIIGSPGAGKSTFARKLKDATGIPLYYLDRLWHKPDQTTVTREAFDMRLHEILQKDRWIIDGNYQRTLEKRMEACDTVFLLDLPLETCLQGAKARVGAKREDMPWVETELDEDFKQWILDFPEHQLPQIYKLIETYRNCKNVVIFQSRKEADDYITALSRRD